MGLGFTDAQGDQITNGNDSIFGNGGNDNIDGAGGNDTIDGGDGDDTIVGWDGNDSIVGGAGNDSLNATTGSTAGYEFGSDSVFGGAGNDTMLAGFGANELYDGGDDTDLLSFEQRGTGSPVNANLTTGDYVLVNGGAGDDDDTTFSGNILNVENLTGTFGNDTLIGDDGANRISGGFEGGSNPGAGNDLIEGRGGDDTLLGGNGNDTIDGGDDNDTIDGGSGDDSIVGGDGDDSIVGFDGADRLIGGDGNDTINNFAGSVGFEPGGGSDIVDFVDAGAGDDFILAGFGSGETIIGGTGNDTYSAAHQFVPGALTDLDLEAGTYLSAGGSGTITGIEDVLGSQANDSITGSNIDNLIEGNNGNDTIAGLRGDDTLTGGAGADILDGDGSATPLPATFNLITNGDFSATSGSGAQTHPDGWTVSESNINQVQVINGEAYFGGGQTAAGGSLTQTIDGATVGEPVEVSFDYSELNNQGNIAVRVRITDTDGNVQLDQTVTNPGPQNFSFTATTTGYTVEIIDASPDTTNNDAQVDNFEVRVPDPALTDDDTISGGAGDDTLIGSDGDDTIDGGADADTVIIDSTDGNATVTGGEAGTDTDTLDLEDASGSNGATVNVTGPEAGTATLGTANVDFSEIEGLDLTDSDDTVTTGKNAGISIDGAGGDDTITITDALLDTEVTGFDNTAEGTFTADDGTVVNFGGATGVTLSSILDGTFVDPVSGSTLGAKGSYSITGGDRTGQFGTVDVTGAETLNFNVVCFARGTLIKTPKGEVPVEELAVDDKVLTQDNGLQPIRWIGSRTFTQDQLDARPNLKPIRIAAGALGAGLPERDLVVSPQHRVLVRSKVAERMFDSSEILVPAKKLLSLHGVEVVEHSDGVEYFHFLCDRHELVWSDGAVTETLHTGEEAMKTMSPEARAEIFEIFPELAVNGASNVHQLARPVPKGAHLRKMFERIHKNGKDAFELVA